MRAKLREAILAGFNPASLDQVLRDNDMLRANVAAGPDFAARVNSLIDVARQEGWLPELCGVLAEARAGNRAVSSAFVAVQEWLKDRHDGDEVDLQFQHPVPRQPNLAALVSIAVATVGLIGVSVWVLVDRKEQTPQVISTGGDRSPVITGTKGNVQINTGQSLTATGGGVVIAGNAINSPINIGTPPEQLAAIIKQSADLSDTQKKLIAELEQKLALNQQQVRAALAIVGEANVAPEHLGSKLVEVAQGLKDLRTTAAPQPGDDPKIAALKTDARKAIDNNELAEADRLLAMIEAEQRRARDRLSDNAAATLAQRGAIALTRLRYAEAANHFVEAAELVPAGEPLLRARYLAFGGTAWRLAGVYPLAETVLTEALRIQEQRLAPDHLDVARSLVALASVYTDQGRYAEAEPLVRRALVIREKALGPDHPDVAAVLGNLAELHWVQGRTAEAEPLMKRALAIDEKALGPEHRHVASDLNNLAAIARTQGRYAEAEPLMKRALAIDEKALGQDHPSLATSLNNLAVLHRAQGRNAEAEPLYKRALAINEKALGPEHPSVGVILSNLSVLYQEQGRLAEAEPLAKRALAISEKALGPAHPHVAERLDTLAGLYTDQGRHADAEPLFGRALTIGETALGAEHPEVATRLINIAALYRAQGRYAESESSAKRALAIREKALGAGHPDVAIALINLAALYRVQGRSAEAEPLYRRTLEIREKALGADHRDTAAVRRDLQTLTQPPPASGEKR